MGFTRSTIVFKGRKNDLCGLDLLTQFLQDSTLPCTLCIFWIHQSKMGFFLKIESYKLPSSMDIILNIWHTQHQRTSIELMLLNFQNVESNYLPRFLTICPLERLIQEYNIKLLILIVYKMIYKFQ
jgi:hypothetical protein